MYTYSHYTGSLSLEWLYYSMSHTKICNSVPFRSHFEQMPWASYCTQENKAALIFPLKNMLRVIVNRAQMLISQQSLFLCNTALLLASGWDLNQQNAHRTIAVRWRVFAKSKYESCLKTEYILYSAISNHSFWLGDMSQYYTLQMLYVAISAAVK